MKKSILTIACASIVAIAATSNAQLTENWFTIDPLVVPGIAGSDDARGLAFLEAGATDEILVASRAGGPNIQRLNADTGANLGALDMTGVSGGTINMVKVKVADDGAIYATNLALDAASMNIYRWADTSSMPTIAFAGVPSQGNRAGDSLAVTGSGTSTVLYVGGSGETVIEVFTTADGSTFTNSGFINLPAGDASSGLTVREDNGNLIFGDAGNPYREITTAGAAVADSTGTDIGGSFNGADFIDTGSTLLLAGAAGNAAGPTVPLGAVFNITAGLDTAVTLGATYSGTTMSGRTSLNTNGNGAADTAFGNETVFILNTNNGVGSYGNAAELGFPTDVSDWKLFSY